MESPSAKGFASYEWVLKTEREFRAKPDLEATLTVVGKRSPTFTAKGRDQSFLYSQDERVPASVYAVGADGKKRPLLMSAEPAHTDYNPSVSLPPGEYRIVSSAPCDWNGIFSEFLESPLPPDGNQ
jgi:hypothetical protein